MTCVREEISRKFGLVALLTGAVFIAGCFGVGEVCEPGEINTCPCGDGEEGVQTCGDSGDRWGSCECGDIDHLRDDTDVGGGTGGDTGSDAPPALDTPLASDTASSLDNCAGTGICADANETCVRFSADLALCITTCVPTGAADQCAAGRSCLNVGDASPSGGLCLSANSAGGICGAYEEALCEPQLVCAMLEAGAETGVCLDRCSTAGATCAGGPAGSDYRCVLGTADNPEACAFLCSPHSSSPCPSGLRCGSDGVCLPCESGDCGGSSGGGGGGGGGSSAPACGGDNIDHCPGFRCCCPGGPCGTVRQCRDGYCVTSEWDVCQDMENGSSPVCNM